MPSDTEFEPFLRRERDSDDILSESQDAEKEPFSHHHEIEHRRQKSSAIVSHCLTILATTLVWACYFLVVTKFQLSTPAFVHEKHNSTLFPTRNYYHCGTSIEEARARDCSYDISTNHYIPTRCVDQASIAEYQEDGSWYGFADANHTELLSIKEMGSRPMYYTNERDHIVHCAMLWRRQFRALKSRRQHLDSLSVDEEHMMHCSKYLIEMTEKGTDFWKIPIEVHVGYAGCHVSE